MVERLPVISEVFRFAKIVTFHAKSSNSILRPLHYTEQ
jgi:hypothetical protein